ncbi:MAG: hypothetical protein K2I95_09540 [Treponemataceae bacterium]|nr:hypothetical protein [Treponemataceae bacterium]
MKYYSFKPCGVETTKFCEPKLCGEWAEEGLWKNKWRNSNIKLPVTMTVKNRYNPRDYPLADSALVSQRLLDTIKQLNKDYEALPTQLYYKEKEPIWDTYYSMIFPEYEVFNFDKSRYILFRDKILDLEELVLSKEKLSHVDIANNIFVIKETPVIIICTETAKDMIEAVGIKDVRFTELPVE